MRTRMQELHLIAKALWSETQESYFTGGLLTTKTISSLKELINVIKEIEELSSRE